MNTVRLFKCIALYNLYFIYQEYFYQHGMMMILSLIIILLIKLYIFILFTEAHPGNSVLSG